MADFDPSTIGAIGDTLPDIVGAKARGAEISEALDRSQLSRLELGQKKQALGEDRQVAEILKGSKYSTPQEAEETAAKINRISPSAAMKFLKTTQDYQSGKVSAETERLELASKQQEVIVGAIDPIVAQARQMKNSGASDLEINAYIAKSTGSAIEQLKNTKGPDGQPLVPPSVYEPIKDAKLDLPTLEGWEQKSKAGHAAIQARLEQQKADTGAKAQSTREKAEDERERHDRETEWLARHKLDKSQFDESDQDLLGAMADKNVSLPAGLRSQAQIQATLRGLHERHPDMTADQIADGLASGKIKLAAEVRAGQTAGTQIGKVGLAANELDTFGDQVLSASRNLPRGNEGLTIRGLLQSGQKQFSDPKLLVLKAKLQALNNAYDQLASRGGTDQDKRAHVHELFDARLSDEGIQALVKAVKEEAAGAREAANRTIHETADTALPGTEQSPRSAAPAAGAPASSSSPTTGAAPAAGASPPLKAGATYQHSSGAKVTILPDSN